jgi:hypothetical protein
MRGRSAILAAPARGALIVNVNARCAAAIPSGPHGTDSLRPSSKVRVRAMRVHSSANKARRHAQRGDRDPRESGISWVTFGAGRGRVTRSKGTGVGFVNLPTESERKLVANSASCSSLAFANLKYPYSNLTANMHLLTVINGIKVWHEPRLERLNFDHLVQDGVYRRLLERQRSPRSPMRICA